MGAGAHWRQRRASRRGGDRGQHGKDVDVEAGRGRGAWSPHRRRGRSSGDVAGGARCRGQQGARRSSCSASRRVPGVEGEGARRLGRGEVEGADASGLDVALGEAVDGEVLGARGRGRGHHGRGMDGDGGIVGDIAGWCRPCARSTGRGLTVGAARDVAVRGRGDDRGELGATVGLVARLDAEVDRGVGDGRARSRPRRGLGVAAGAVAGRGRRALTLCSRWMPRTGLGAAGVGAGAVVMVGGCSVSSMPRRGKSKEVKRRHAAAAERSRGRGRRLWFL